MMLRLSLPLMLCGLLSAGGTTADLVVVVNAQSGVERLTQQQVTNIFLGRYRQFPTGHVAVPIDQPGTSTDKARFYRLLVDKDLREIDAYWARLVFSGKTRPPIEAENPSEILQRLARDRGAISYMDRSHVDLKLKIVFSFEP